MRERLRLRWGKKAFFDIEDLFAFLVYVIILFFFIVIISIPSCRGSTTANGLGAGSSGIDRLGSEQQVVEMLRTQLPEDLPKLIAEKSGTEIGGLNIYLHLDFAAAKEFLEKNQAVYSRATYAEFIDRLQYSVRDKSGSYSSPEAKKARANVFAVVTRAVFVKEAYPPHLLENQPGLKKLLAYPEVYVRYGVAGYFAKEFEADLANPPLSPGAVRTENVFALVPLTMEQPESKPRIATIMLGISPGAVRQ